ncbi:aminoglycoside phosphotransferase family protein [Cellulomonas sp. P22]|uniref:aminoglycoside phosphotransferase family protein n=1 Tax=Cellulomonas sp. P22 TaxID=3373189 RepID=UPI00378F9F06
MPHETVPDLTVPPILHDGVGRSPAGAAWVAALPGLVARAVERWDLVPGEPFPDGAAAWTAPVRRADGTEAVLKIVLPHDEARHEAAALREWAGRGTVRLLAHEPSDWALLLERVRPGRPLTASTLPADDRLRAAAAVHRTLTGLPVGPGLDDVPHLVDVCRDWAPTLLDRAGRAAVEGEIDVDGGLVASAHGLLLALPVPGAADVVLHGDLNPGNLLEGPDGRWVAIDPKPVRGDAAFDLWPLLEQVDPPFRASDPARVLGERTALLADELGLEVQRIAAWAFARCTESALWRWDELGDLTGAQRELDRAAVWETLAR